MLAYCIRRMQQCAHVLHANSFTVPSRYNRLPLKCLQQIHFATKTFSITCPYIILRAKNFCRQHRISGDNLMPQFMRKTQRLFRIIFRKIHDYHDYFHDIMLTYKSQYNTTIILMSLFCLPIHDLEHNDVHNCNCDVVNTEHADGQRTSQIYVLVFGFTTRG